MAEPQKKATSRKTSAQSAQDKKIRELEKKLEAYDEKLKALDPTHDMEVYEGGMSSEPSYAEHYQTNGRTEKDEALDEKEAA